MKRGLGSALVLASICACHLVEQSDEETRADRSVAVDPADHAVQVDSKLRRFSACRDTLSSVIHESWERYNDQVGADGTPRLRREGVYLRGIGDNTFRSCNRTLEVAKSPPNLPTLETAARECVALASAYAELTRKLERYLDDAVWKTDDWAGLFELDGQLRSAHADWQTCDVALQQAIDVGHLENDPILIGVLEQRRSALEVATRKLMLRARPLVRCLLAAAPEAETCTPLYDAFTAASAEFSQLYTGQRAEADKVFWMATFAIDVDEFRALIGDSQAKLRARRLKQADVQAISDAWSSLVRDAETLDFDFP
jgi:hypothetical protein